MATEYANLVIKLDSSELDTANTKLNKVAKTGAVTEKATKKVTQASVATNTAFRGMGRSAGQLSYQIQDVAVQAQLGASNIQILAQQGPQIASIFGPGGAVIGALVAVGAAIGSSLIDPVEDSQESIDELISRADLLANSFHTLSIAQKNAAQLEIRNNIESLNEEINELRSQSEAAASKINALEMSKRHAIGSTAEYDEQIQELTETIIINNGAIKKYTGDIKSYKAAMKNSPESQKMLNQLELEVALLGKTKAERARIIAEKKGASPALAKEIEAKARLLELHEIEQKAKKQQIADMEAIEAAEIRLQQQIDRQQATKQRDEERAVKTTTALTGLDDTELERIDAMERTRLERINEYRDQGLIDEQLYEEAKTAILIDGERQRSDVAIQAAEDRTRMMSDGLDILLGKQDEVTKAGIKMAINLADVEKRENAKKIISGSYSTAMKAYESLAIIPVVGPALGAVAAAGIITAGASYAANSLAGRALGGQVRPGESYVVGERGPEVLTMGASGGNIIPNDKLSRPPAKQVDQRSPQMVSFHIHALDGNSVEEVLQNQRGHIINMLNQAANDQGKDDII